MIEVTPDHLNQMTFCQTIPMIFFNGFPGLIDILHAGHC